MKYPYKLDMVEALTHLKSWFENGAKEVRTGEEGLKRSREECEKTAQNYEEGAKMVETWMAGKGTVIPKDSDDEDISKDDEDDVDEESEGNDSKHNTTAKII